MQKLGQVAWKALPTSAVRLFLSKYGLKVTDSAKKVRAIFPRRFGRRKDAQQPVAREWPSPRRPRD